MHVLVGEHGLPCGVIQVVVDGNQTALQGGVKLFHVCAIFSGTDVTGGCHVHIVPELEAVTDDPFVEQSECCVALRFVCPVKFFKTDQKVLCAVGGHLCPLRHSMSQYRVVPFLAYHRKHTEVCFIHCREAQVDKLHVEFIRY